MTKQQADITIALLKDIRAELRKLNEGAKAKPPPTQPPTQPPPTDPSTLKVLVAGH